MNQDELVVELKESATLAMDAGKQGKYLLLQGDKDLWYKAACEQKRLLERCVEILELLGDHRGAQEGRQIAAMDEFILREYREGRVK